MGEHRVRRRDFLGTAASVGLALSPAFSILAADDRRLFKIGACDWSIRQGGQPKAMAVAKEIGLDGVQVSFGPPR